MLAALHRKLLVLTGPNNLIVGHQDFRHEQATRRRHERCCEKVLEFGAHEDVTRKNCARYRRQARDHHGKKLRFRQVSEIRFDDQRCLGLANKDVGRCIHRFDCPGTNDLVQRTAHAFDQVFHNSQVIHHGHQCRKEDDDWQHIDCETETDDLSIGQRTKHHVDTCLRETDNREYACADAPYYSAARIRINNECRNHRL